MENDSSIPSPNQSTASSIDSENIDLIAHVLAALGVTVNRPRPTVLAGVVNGLIEGPLLFAEIDSASSNILVTIQSGTSFTEELATKMRERVMHSSARRECEVAGVKWMRLGVSAPRLGRRYIVLGALIKATDDGRMSPQYEERIATIVTFVRSQWPSW